MADASTSDRNQELLQPHVYRVGPNHGADLSESILADSKELEKLRRNIEPWLTAVFQSEHLSVLLGNGFTTGVALSAGGKPATMDNCRWTDDLDFRGEVDEFADSIARVTGRASANIEDQLRAAMQLTAGLKVMNDSRAGDWADEIDAKLKQFLDSILACEASIRNADPRTRDEAEDLLVSFLLSFASRAATRERLNLFTTNYDRLIEFGCDIAGLHVIDRFVGTLSPVFRATRLNIDIHYNPPGIRGEPRYLEGVVRLNKLHGSLDWRWEDKELRRHGIPFGASAGHPEVPDRPSDSVMIYPNPAKDVETLDYPYSELFRDFAAAVCRPNSSLVTYGYGFGDDHLNRIIKDMLTIPSTHLVIIAWDKTVPDDLGHSANSIRRRIIGFCQNVGKRAQISLLLGSHFGDLKTLVENYLPKPAIDPISIRKTRLMEQRGEEYRRIGSGDDHEQTD